MSDIITAAVAALNARLAAGSFDGVAKFAIADIGAVIIDENGAHAGDEDADVTLNADAETFQAIMDGDMNPTAAFMQGKLTVDGDMGLAMRLASVLA